MKPKSDGKSKDWMKDLRNSIEERRGTYVKSRYYLVEITPPKAYRVGDGHGGTDREWSREKRTVVSSYFDTVEEVELLLEKYEPDEGNSFVVQEDKLYSKVVETWH